MSTPHAPRHGNVALGIVAFTAATLALVACNRTPDAEEAAATDEQNEGTTGADPCSLLEVREVEAAIGPLAGPPYRLGNQGPDREGDRCVYETRDLHSLQLGVDWTDGAMVMRMLGMPAGMAKDAGLKGKLPLPDGVTLTGEWDEAKAIGCCSIQTLRGDQGVSIDFGNTSLPTAQAVTLLDQALRRLDAPLSSIDGARGVKAALTREKEGTGRPKPVPACTLVTEADAVALIGPVERLPSDTDRRCEYRSRGKPQVISFSVAFQGGYREMREKSAMSRSLMRGMLGDLAKPDTGDDAASEKASAKEEYPGPWESAAVVALAFSAVRQDVLMSVDVRGTSLDNARAVVAGAMQRVDWAH